MSAPKPLWVPGWLSEGGLVIGAGFAVWHGLGLQASIFIVGAAVIGVMRQIERDRRAAQRADAEGTPRSKG